MRTFSGVVLPLLPVFFFVVIAEAQTKISNFGLKDQNDRYTEVNFPSDRPVVLIFGDHKGAGQIDGRSSSRKAAPYSLPSTVPRPIPN